MRPTALALALPVLLATSFAASAANPELIATPQTSALGGLPTGGPFVPAGNLYDNRQSDGTTSLASQNSSGTTTARSADDFILTGACPSGQFAISQIRVQMVQADAAPQAFAVDLFADNGSNTAPASGITPIATLAQTSQVSLAPFGTGTSLFEASFTPASPLLLPSNTRFWISGYGADPAANPSGFSNFFAASPGAAGTTANGMVIAPGAGVADWTPASAVVSAELAFAFAIDGTCAVLDADLSLSLSATPSQVSTGGSITYTAVASNAGPADAADLAISFTLPMGSVFSSSSTSAGGSCSGTAPVVCTFAGATPSGSSRTASFIVSAPSTLGAISASASVTSNNSDPVSANNTASATVTGVTPGNPRPAVVPATGTAGLGLMAALLALIGVVALRRFR